MGIAPRADGPLAQAGISLPNWALHPRPPSTPHQELRPGPWTYHTHRVQTTPPQILQHGAQGVTHRPSAETGHQSLLASGPAGPLTMMASACLASSSETALRKPLGCGAAGLEVGMVPARSRALLRSPLPGGLLKAEPTSQPLRVPHLPPPRLRPPSCLWPPAGGRRGGRGEREARGRALSH